MAYRDMARFRRILLIVALPAALFLGWLGSELYYSRRNYLPESVTTYHQFLETMPEPAELALVTVSGQTYLQVIGPLPRGLTLPSGPPVYVFDSGGGLVAWTLDSGDDPGFASTWWFPSSQRRSITFVQAQERFAS